MKKLEYRNPIRMPASDPICSASALGNTIIGILFDKKGNEIQQAIKARTVVIDKKIDEYQGVVSKVDKFVEEKKVILEELDDFYRDQSDKKNALLKPYQDSLDVIRKEFNGKFDKVNKDMSDAIFSFDKDTSKQIGKKAVGFEKSFNDFKEIFSDVSDFLEEEEEIIEKEPIRGAGFGDRIGVKGCAGSPGVSGTVGTDNDSVQTYSYVTPGAFVNQVYGPTKEDEATAKLNTLRSLLAKYSSQIEILKESIRKLEEEKRRLNLISGNINPDREYKLDLNKLSAFGFEDVEIS
jgi:hypothetical protein